MEKVSPAWPSPATSTSPLPRWLLPSRPRRLPLILVTLATALVMMMVYFLLTLTTFPCVSGVHCYKGYSSDHSFDANRSHRPDWMASIPDAAKLTDLSVPGTHDTMTYSLVGDISLQCQNQNLSMQLQSGLRYFDIRARLRDDELRIYHAAGDTGFDLGDVLSTMFDFLEANPSETLIVRLKQEGRPIGHNARSFEDAFLYYTKTDPRTAPRAPHHIHPYDGGAPLPNLGALRSKIFLLTQFPTPSGAHYGVTWESARMRLEDLWIIPDVYHLAEKWTAIRDALELAATAPLDNSVLYLAHVSASVGVLPIEAAAGPMNRTVVGMNDMTGQWLEDFSDEEDALRAGVVIIDFPGKDLIDAVLSWNSWLEDPDHAYYSKGQ